MSPKIREVLQALAEAYRADASTVERLLSGELNMEQAQGMLRSPVASMAVLEAQAEEAGRDLAADLAALTGG